jgi:hypothetical protein
MASSGAYGLFARAASAVESSRLRRSSFCVNTHDFKVCVKRFVPLAQAPISRCLEDDLMQFGVVARVRLAIIVVRHVPLVFARQTFDVLGGQARNKLRGLRHAAARRA